VRWGAKGTLLACSLAVLAEADGAVVTRSDLLDRVWPASHRRDPGDRRTTARHAAGFGSLCMFIGEARLSARIDINDHDDKVGFTPLIVAERLVSVDDIQGVCGHWLHLETDRNPTRLLEHQRDIDQLTHTEGRGKSFEHCMRSLLPEDSLAMRRPNQSAL
jgi:hypothetical protein